MISSHYLLLVLCFLPSLALAYTTIDDASVSASLWSSGQFEVLLDVRRLEEWDAGHLPNATFIPSLHESRDTSRLDDCKDCAIAVYCRSGRRSKLAADVLDAAGFTNVYDVLGVNQWMDVGVTLVSDAEREPCCLCDECVNAKNEGYSNGISMLTFMVAVLYTGAVLCGHS